MICLLDIPSKERKSESKIETHCKHDHNRQTNHQHSKKRPQELVASVCHFQFNRVTGTHI